VIWLLQLVVDCHDPDAVTRFWGRLLDYDSELARNTPEETRRFREDHPQFDGRGRIDDRQLRRMPIYLQRVPEPKQDRNRVRLEVTVPRGDRAPGDALDPEGNEYVVVVDESAREPRLSSIVIDALDPAALAAFWADATGFRLGADATSCQPHAGALDWTGHAFAHPAALGLDLLHVTGTGAPPGPAPYDLTPSLSFSKTETPKATKNRLHLDLYALDPLLERERLVSRGATVLQWDTDHVLADPEGNEFCLGGRVRPASSPLPPAP